MSPYRFRAAWRQFLRSLVGMVDAHSRHFEFVDESCVQRDGSLRPVPSMIAPEYIDVTEEGYV